MSLCYYYCHDYRKESSSWLNPTWDFSGLLIKANRKTLPARLQGENSLSHMKLGTLSLLCSQGIRALCGHASHTPSLVPSSLCLFEVLRKVFFFFFPPSFLFLSSSFFSAQRSFLSSSAQILIVAKKGQTMDTLFLLLLSTSTFPLLAAHSSHPPPFTPKSVSWSFFCLSLP